MTSDKAQVIKVPNLLRAKVGNRPGPDLNQIVRQAESALDGMQEQYETWIRDYVAKINEALAKARRSVPPDPEAIALILKTSHDIKGQGLTFGYPLLTRVGHMLHHFIEHSGGRAARSIDLIAAHIEFMNLVLQDQIHDDGSVKEQQILAGLEAAASKLMKAKGPA